MTKARRDGLLLLVLASTIFLGVGFLFESADSSLPDFKGIYYGTRCLLQHADPYKVSDVRRIYRAEAWQRPPEPPESPDDPDRPFVMAQIYLPGTFLVTLPFACLAWGPAHLLWITLAAAAFLLAAFCAWDLGSEFAPVFSACLIGFLVINSMVLFTSGNPAGLAVSLCVIATWSFLRGRCLAAGTVCLAISLVFKPHDSGFVWLYFLLSGGAQKKRALQALAISTVLGLIGTLWVSPVAPRWFPEMRANLAQNLQSGLDDPGPNAPYARTASAIIDLQTEISFFRDDPRVYNPVAYLIIGTLLLCWVIATLRVRPSHTMALLALAPIVSLTLLPVYHRAVDARLLMLAVPACSMLLAKRGAVARLALAINVGALVLTGDIPLILLLHLSDRIHLSATGLAGALLRITLFRPVPLALLLMSIVNLAVLFKRSASRPASHPLSPDSSPLSLIP